MPTNYGEVLAAMKKNSAGGLARIDGIKCMVIGHEKGRETKDKLKRNFGCAGPEGYRKALRMMRMAEKFNIPIVSIIDTPGAYPGVEAEERNIAESIAFNLREMIMLKTPIIAGGSIILTFFKSHLFQ